MANLEDAVEAVDLAGGLDRTAIRTSTLNRFDVPSMVDKYIAVYRKVLEHKRSTL